MRVGYTIKSLQNSSQKREFSRFLKDTLILEEGYADNIAEILVEGDPVNIYTQRNLSEELNGNSSYDFSAEYTAIIPEGGEYIVASAVDFRLEIQFQGGVKVLAPTEYFVTTESLARTLLKEIKQGVLKTFPSIPAEEGSEWLLGEGSWNDDGIWVDEENWKDRGG